MRQRQIQYILIAAALLIAVAGSYFGIVLPVPEVPLPVESQAIAKTQFQNIFVDHDVDINGNADVDGTLNADVTDIDGAVDMATTLTIGTGLTVTAGGVTVSDGDVVVADDLRVTAQTSITVTNGAAFTPTGTYQPIAAAGTVTPTVTVGTAGDVVTLINTSNTTINIADSGTAKLAGAVALGQYDSIILWCDGTNWIEVSRSNN